MFDTLLIPDAAKDILLLRKAAERIAAALERLAATSEMATVADQNTFRSAYTAEKDAPEGAVISQTDEELWEEEEKHRQELGLSKEATE